MLKPVLHADKWLLSAEPRGAPEHRITFLLWVTLSSGQALASTRNASRHGVPALLPELGGSKQPTAIFK